MLRAAVEKLNVKGLCELTRRLRLRGRGDRQRARLVALLMAHDDEVGAFQGAVELARVARYRL